MHTAVHSVTTLELKHSPHSPAVANGAPGPPAPDRSPMAAAAALVRPVRPSGGARIGAALRCGRTRRRGARVTPRALFRGGAHGTFP